MSTTGQCPSCGNTLTFRVATSTTVVCEFCESIVVRGGAQLELVGKVNEILATGSVLKLGVEGKYRGRAFTLVGRTQLSHDLGGVWDEWVVAFDDGKVAWLAEHQGRLQMMTEANASSAPTVQSHQTVKPGQRMHSSIGELVVVERGEATIAGEEGELPLRALMGSRRPFLDFSSRTGRVATLDFGTVMPDGTRDRRRWYVGREVTREELGLGAAEIHPVVLGRAEGAQTLRCPHCGAPVEKKLTEALSLVCSSCNSGLSVEQDGRLGFLFAQEKLAHRPHIKVGTTARLDEGFFRRRARSATSRARGRRRSTRRSWPTWCAA
jgi:ribosomal protein L37AE/L43A